MFPVCATDVCSSSILMDRAARPDGKDSNSNSDEKPPITTDLAISGDASSEAHPPDHTPHPPPLTSAHTPEEVLRNEAALLELSDSVRRHLRDTRTLGPGAKLVSRVLRRCREQEVMGLETLRLSTIKYAHLDKLAVELMNRASYAEPWRYRNEECIGAARFLLGAWRHRYRQEWFAVDGGRTRGVGRPAGTRGIGIYGQASDVPGRWTSRTGPAGVSGAGAEFVPGSWWFNLSCAHRDGIVGSALDRPTYGQYGIAVLPLITGREEHDNGEASTYIRVGKNRDMFYSLMTQVGSQTRVLRGYGLKSIIAPSAGVRYDGVYVVRAWGIASDQGTYTMTVTLERVPGQKPMEVVAMAPWPSQLDDWRLYGRHEAETSRKNRRQPGYVEIRVAEERNRDGRQRYRRMKEIRASLGSRG